MPCSAHVHSPPGGHRGQEPDRAPSMGDLCLPVSLLDQGYLVPGPQASPAEVLGREAVSLHLSFEKKKK